MDARVRRVREESDHRKHGSRFSSAGRREAVSVARERLGQDALLAGVARELTVSGDSLRRWLARDPPPFRAVDVVDDRAAPAIGRPGFVLLTAGGHRLEGLDVASAVAVLRALEATA
jgi:hypothetical protein